MQPKKLNNKRKGMGTNEPASTSISSIQPLNWEVVRVGRGVMPIGRAAVVEMAGLFKRVVRVGFKVCSGDLQGDRLQTSALDTVQPFMVLLTLTSVS